MGSSSNISSPSSRHAHHTSPTAMMMMMMMSLRRRRRRQRRILSLIILFSIVVSFQYTATNIVIVEAVVVEAAGAAVASSENENEIESESLSSGSCATSSNVDNDNNETVCITESMQLNSSEIYAENENENKDEDENEMKENRQCIFDAKNGLCDKFPKDMFQRCPYSCIHHNEKLGSIIYLENKNDDDSYNENDDNDNDNDNEIDICENLIEDEICEEYAHYNELNCLRNQSYMWKHCPKSCLKCFDFINNSSIEINIGVTQIIDDSIMMETTNDNYKPTTSKDTGIITKFLSTIEKTNDYMVQQVMKEDKYMSVRKYCHNYSNLCTLGVTTKTPDVFCNQDNNNGITNKLVCGPACHSCDEMLLSQQEMDILYDCTPDTSSNIFIDDNEEEEDDEDEDEDEVNAEDEDNKNNEQNGQQQQQQQKITLDTMFQRIIGEVPYPKEYADQVPSFDATVLSRPKLNPIIHQTMSIHDLKKDIDFVLGGPWIIQLDNFLTDEECTRLIELGDSIGRDISTIEVDDDESSSEVSTSDKDEDNNDDDNDIDIDSKSENEEEDDEEEEEEQWRTSTTAWCDEDDCKDDPITKRVQEKIGFTTSVLDPAYFEHLQLLKYVPGQFYKNHHDESGSQHDIDYNSSGPRILTFFLYLNDLDDDDDDDDGAGAGAGGETRFTNIFGDDTNIYLDVKPKKGRALIWPSMLIEDLYEFEPKTYHEARIVNKGNKYGANAWLHLRDVRNLHCDEDQLEPIRSKLDQIQQQ